MDTLRNPDGAFEQRTQAKTRRAWSIKGYNRRCGRANTVAPRNFLRLGGLSATGHPHERVIDGDASLGDDRVEHPLVC